MKKERYEIDLESVRVLRFQDGSIIIAIVESLDDRGRTYFVKAPVSLRLIYAEGENEPEGYHTAPFLSPFIHFDPHNVLMLNSDHITCDATPSEYMARRFKYVVEATMNQEEISEKILSEIDSGDVGDETENTVKLSTNTRPH